MKCRGDLGNLRWAISGLSPRKRPRVSWAVASLAPGVFVLPCNTDETRKTHSRLEPTGLGAVRAAPLKLLDPDMKFEMHDFLSGAVAPPCRNTWVVL